MRLCPWPGAWYPAGAAIISAVIKADAVVEFVYVCD